MQKPFKYVIKTFDDTGKLINRYRFKTKKAAKIKQERLKKLGKKTNIDREVK